MVGKRIFLITWILLQLFCNYFPLKISILPSVLILGGKFLLAFNQDGLRYAAVGKGNGTPLQYPRLENPMEGGAW